MKSHGLATAAVAFFWLLPGTASAAPALYGSISRLTAKPADRDTLVAGLAKECGRLKGCISYVVARDGADKAAVWVTEIWSSKADHDAALRDPRVQATMKTALPLVTNIPEVTVTIPVAGAR